MANNAKGLGKGLAALLGDNVMESSQEKSSLYLPISQVESCAAQPRKQFDPDALADLADFVLVEADGSRRRPMKAHARHEPVIPPCTRQVICVVGLSGLHRPVSEVVHRPELFCPLVGCTPEDEATPERVARALVQEHLADTYFLNQAESGSALQDAKIIASHLKSQGFSVVAGSQREKSYFVL